MLVAHSVLAGVTFIAIFIMFLVISRTLNTIINLLVKLEYVIRREFDLKEELLEVRRLMEEQGVGMESAPPVAEKKKNKNT